MTEYLGDLESDFSRFHRIDDIYSLDGPHFMRLAWRISVYGGVMSLRINTQQRDDAPPATSSPSPSAARLPRQDNVTWISPAAFAMMHGAGV